MHLKTAFSQCLCTDRRVKEVSDVTAPHQQTPFGGQQELLTKMWLIPVYHVLMQLLQLLLLSQARKMSGSSSTGGCHQRQVNSHPLFFWDGKSPQPRGVPAVFTAGTAPAFTTVRTLLGPIRHCYSNNKTMSQRSAGNMCSTLPVWFCSR